MSITFFVEGIPKPGGSKKAFYSKRLGRALIVDACKGNKDWRACVMAFAREAYSGTPLRGPLSVSATFYMPRPKAHFRKDGNVKPGAPHFPTGRPDLTKLWRSTEDALTDCGIWADDAQIVAQQIIKGYPPESDYAVGARIEIETWGT